MRMHIHGVAGMVALTLALATATGTAASLTAPPPDRGEWVWIGALDEARYGHSATLLDDGTALVVGGMHGRRPLLTAELVYPQSGASRAAGVLPFGLHHHDAVALPDGRVLVAGGRGGRGEDDLCATYPPLVWDPATLAFLPVPGIEDANGASATLLDDGRVLLAGGGTECSWRPWDGLKINSAREGLAAATIWDPVSGAVTPTSPLALPRAQHEAVRLPDGRVLVLGGSVTEYHTDVIMTSHVPAMELWDPATGTWQPAGELDDGGATVLSDGRIVMSERPRQKVRYVLWDPATGEATPAPDALPTRRAAAASAVLADGRLMLVGGYRIGERAYQPLASAVLWDPVSGEGETVKYPRAGADTGQTMTALPDGTVLVIGGRDMHGRGDRTIGSIEAWQP